MGAYNKVPEVRDLETPFASHCLISLWKPL